MTISPSKLASQAAGEKNRGMFAAKQPGFCVMCGHAHSEGEMVSNFVPLDSFTDYNHLKCKESRIICGWCSVLMGDFFTQKGTRSVITQNGFFPAASDENISYWLLNPPEGSWLWVFSDQKRQHIIWRAPVNTNQDIFQIAAGEIIVTIRRKKLLQALEKSKRLAQISNEANKSKKGVKLKSPFVRLSRDLDEIGQGSIRSDIHKLVTNNDDEDKGAKLSPELKEETRVLIRELQSLTPGEIWALGILQRDKAPVCGNPYVTPHMPFVASVRS